MDTVFQKTRELGQALLNSEAYLKMKEAEDRTMQDQEAAETMASFLEKRGELHTMMQSENPDPVAMKRLSDEMDALQDRMQMIDAVIELTQARNAFNGLIAQINQVLQFIVTGRMEEADCGGDCSACGGCH